MARPLRICYEGAWYHVMNRGAGKRNIFHSNTERFIFLELLERIHFRYKIEIHSYCLMDNHYHLLIKTPFPNISQAIKYLDGVYAQKINIKRDTDGPLFRGRFKTKLVDDDCYLTHLSRYIHLNPVKANLCKEPWEYRWSSCKEYLGLIERNPWLFVQEILQRFGSDNKYIHYQQFLSDRNETYIEEFFLKKIPAIGTKDFIKNIKEKFLNKVPNTEMPEEKQIKNIILPTIEEIIIAACAHFEISHDNFYQFGIQNKFIRNIIIFLAIEFCNMTLNEVADYFGTIKRSRVSIIYKKMLKETTQNDQLKKVIDKIVSDCGK